MKGITDVFVQNISGLPYISRCYSNELCSTGKSHSLIAGFFSALNAFTTEIRQTSLRIIGFDIIEFILECEGDILVIFGLERGEYDEEAVRKIGRMVREEFVVRFGEQIRTKGLLNADLNDFIYWIDEQIEQSSMKLDFESNKRNLSFRQRVFKKLRLN